MAIAVAWKQGITAAVGLGGDAVAMLVLSLVASVRRWWYLSHHCSPGHVTLLAHMEGAGGLVRSLVCSLLSPPLGPPRRRTPWYPTCSCWLVVAGGGCCWLLLAAGGCCWWWLVVVAAATSTITCCILIVTLRLPSLLSSHRSHKWLLAPISPHCSVTEAVR